MRPAEFTPGRPLTSPQNISRFYYRTTPILYLLFLHVGDSKLHLGIIGICDLIPEVFGIVGQTT